MFVFMSLCPRTITILISNWPRTWKISQLFKNYRRGRRFLTMVSRLLWLFKIWQVSSCGEIMQHLETCWLWQLGWQSFVSPCDVFNCLFPLDVQNEIQLLSRIFCYSCLVYYWVFGCEMRRLSRSEIREAFKVSSDSGLKW